MHVGDDSLMRVDDLLQVLWSELREEGLLLLLVDSEDLLRVAPDDFPLGRQVH